MTAQELQEKVNETDVQQNAREMREALDDAESCETLADVKDNLLIASHHALRVAKEIEELLQAC